uniref:Leucine zipper transcription factor-like protein 1 n=1 Tax=Globisporangium ultimum (strain ATCC 200006 / CBS 805.95 / DAOM BR144) TaxID=431595 RepID=K3WT36_GLOUD
MGAAASDYFTPHADVQYGFLDAELAIENLHELAARGDYHRVSMRLKQGMDPNGKMFPEDDAYEREDSPMICAARGYLWNKGRKRHVKTLDVLLRFGANVNQYNNLEQTPLYVACDRNLITIATWLLTHGADVNKRTKAGVSPLLCAYRNQNHELVTLLLSHGAIALEPPKVHSCLKFPVLLTEMAAAENPSEATTVATSSDDDSDAEAHRKQQQHAQQFAKLVHDDIHTHVQHEAAVRDTVLQRVNDAKRIEDQRVYRAQLAEEGAKRKERRRRTRDRAKYDAFVTKIERKRLEHAPAMQSQTHEASASLPRLGDHSNSRSHSQTAKSMDSVPPELLAWEKRHGSPGQRPHWAPQEVWTRRHADDRASEDAHCEQLHSTLQRARQRHGMKRQRGAPDAAASIRLGRFLKFFRARLTTHLENVDADFEDTRSDRLSSDDVYSQKDIKEALQSLCFAVKANVRSELQDTINMMALLLRQIFSEAELKKMALELDLGSVEDRELLARVERLSVAEWIDAENGGAASVSALPKPKASAGNSAASSPTKEQLAVAQRKKEHEEELRAALHTSKVKGEQHVKETKKLQRKLDDARERIDELERALDDAKQHVSQTPQFQSMKRMVTQKNDQLRAMRHRLLRYEPDYCDDDGETKDADDD